MINISFENDLPTFFKTDEMLSMPAKGFDKLIY